MRLSTAFLLAFVSIMYGYSLPLEAESKRGNLASKQLDVMDRKLTVIRGAQEEQQRKLITMDFKLNQVLSKMIHLTHAKPAKEELSFNLSMALDKWQSSSNKLEQQINKLQISLERRNEHDKQLEKHSQQLELLSEDAKLEIANGKESKYVQPAKADCFELDVEQRVDGVYKFLEPELNERQRDINERYCAFATDGSAWTVIQRRRTNWKQKEENFHRNWDEYRTGFGDLSNDFWFGNEFIHKIVYRDDYILRIELQDHNGIEAWIEYGLFRLDSESYNYQLVIGKLNENSTTSDALTYHNRMDFTTYDHRYDDTTIDNDNGNDNGWWSVAKSNLNGHSILWHNEYSLNASRMLIRPLNINPLLIATDDSYDEDTSLV
ncbi:angiopoietin-4 [Drosophila innubila]|uniref:angiopoietin-4 n=1 Tax=Drosophila innubila TaxID=198719 RepID=UPI00148B3CFB|nr:angiopoietin-4 [Drosophila innubila]